MSSFAVLQFCRLDIKVLELIYRIFTNNFIIIYYLIIYNNKNNTKFSFALSKTLKSSLQKCKSAKVRKWMYVGDCFKKWLIIKPSKPLLFSIICPKYFGRLDYFHYLCSKENNTLYDETDQRRIQRETGTAVRTVHQGGVPVAC